MIHRRTIIAADATILTTIAMITLGGKLLLELSLEALETFTVETVGFMEGKTEGIICDSGAVDILLDMGDEDDENDDGARIEGLHEVGLVEEEIAGLRVVGFLDGFEVG